MLIRIIIAVLFLNVISPSLILRHHKCRPDSVYGGLILLFLSRPSFRPDRRHGPAGTRDVPGDFPRICHIFWRDGQDQLESPPMRMYALPDVNAEPRSSEDSFESDLWMTVIAGRKAFAGAL